MVFFDFTLRVCAIVVLTNGLIMRLRPLGVELSFHCYFDSRSLPGATPAVEKHIFMVRARAVFTRGLVALFPMVV